MKKKIVATLMCLALLLTLTPAAALAVSGDYTMEFSATTPVTWGTEVVNIDFSTTNASGTGWNWTAGTNPTLTLNGLDFTTTHEVAMHLPTNTTIVLQGNNTVTSTYAVTANPNTESYGIDCEGKLTIRGGGSLTATAGASKKVCVGILASGDMLIEGGTITANGGACSGFTSYGAVAEGSLTVSDGSLTGNGGVNTVNAMGMSIGAYARAGITVNGGSLTGNGSSAVWESVGVSSVMSTINVTGDGSLTGNGGAPARNSTGVFAETDISVSNGGSMDGTAEDAVESCGVISRAGSLTLSGGSVTGTAGNATTDEDANASSLGVHASGSITVSDGILTGTAGNATSNGTGSNSRALTTGVTANLDSLTVTGGTLSGAAGNASCVVRADSWGVFAWQTLSLQGGVTVARGNSCALVSTTSVTPNEVNLSYAGGYVWKQNSSGTTPPSGHETGTYTRSDNYKYLEFRSSPTPCMVPTGRIFDEGVAQWDISTNHLNGYRVQLYKNGTTDSHKIGGVVETSTNEYDFSSAIQTEGEGTYYYKAMAKGDGFTYLDSAWSDESVACNYYGITDDANGAWTKGSQNGISVTSNGNYAKFDGVKVDGSLLSDDKFTAKSGSTIVTLKPEFLKTLQAGTHTLTIIFTDGFSRTSFTVKSDAPQTGDSSSVILWIGLACIACAGIIALVVMKRKQQR